MDDEGLSALFSEKWDAREARVTSGFEARCLTPRLRLRFYDLLRPYPCSTRRTSRRSIARTGEEITTLLVERASENWDKLSLRMAVSARNREDLTFYPDHDDMGESTLQRLMTELLRPLLARFLAERHVRCFVGADQFFYYVKGKPKAVVAPDVYVLPGVDPASVQRCWKLWETGIAPSFALEIMSEVDDLKDITHAPARHDALGTKELIVFDPYVDVESGRTRFRIHRRDAQGKLVLVETTNQDRVKSLELGCFLRAVGEGATLRLRVGVGADGEELVPTDAELVKANAKLARAAAKRARVEAERARVAEQARAEVEAENARLRAELEALRRR